MDDIDSPASPSFEVADTPLAAPCRRDGWTPFARRLFLEVLAETGRVSRACDYAQLTPQSAYALRHRDIVFAAGWDAACAMARAPLADALYEQAIDGVTETIRRDGAIVAERHRHDSRLSIAVLHRLDKRCDLAEERGARHLPLVRRWDEWLDHVGKGEDEQALAMLDPADAHPARHHQLHQLPLGANPTASDDELDSDDEFLGHFWQSKGQWRTEYPPPENYVGTERGQWGSRDYSRSCTDEEAALLDQGCPTDHSTVRDRAAAERAAFFAGKAADNAKPDDLPPPAPSA